MLSTTYPSPTSDILFWTNNSFFQWKLRDIIKGHMDGLQIDTLTLAWASDMRVDYLRHVLAGKRVVSIKTLDKIAPHLHTTTEKLLTEATRVFKGN